MRVAAIASVLVRNPLAVSVRKLNPYPFMYTANLLTCRIEEGRAAEPDAFVCLFLQFKQ